LRERRGRRPAACLDVGQSTGGFTDCLLQHGAAQVVGVDVGHAQLHAKVRGDARVVAIEGSAMRGRELDAEALGRVPADFDLRRRRPVVHLADAGAAGGRAGACRRPLLMLVKPQFELQPGQVGKGGVVRDETLYPVVEKRLRDACAACGLKRRRLVRQPHPRWRRQPRVLPPGNQATRRFLTHGPDMTFPISLEFFPPKTDEGAEKLRAARQQAVRAARVLLGHVRRRRLHPGRHLATVREIMAEGVSRAAPVVHRADHASIRERLAAYAMRA
jgi:hypothetical protein